MPPAPLNLGGGGGAGGKLLVGGWVVDGKNCAREFC